MAAGAWAALRSVVKPCIAGSLIGLTVSDRYFSLAAVHGLSMRPTFEGNTGGREYALVKRSPLYDYSRGEVVIFVSPVDHRSKTIKRVIGLPGDWISVPETEEIRKIPEGHCWVEGDNGSVSWDSRAYGPEPAGIIIESDDDSEGRTSRVILDTEPGRIHSFLCMLFLCRFWFLALNGRARLWLVINHSEQRGSRWQLHLLVYIALHIVFNQEVRNHLQHKKIVMGGN